MSFRDEVAAQVSDASVGAAGQGYRQSAATAAAAAQAQV